MEIKLSYFDNLILKLISEINENISLEEKTWLHIVHRAKELKLSSLVFYKNNNIPEYIKKELFKEYKNTIFKNMIILEEVKKIIYCFIENKIDFIPLKGFILSQTTYEDIGLRPMDDVDFLIKPCDFALAENILSKSGYKEYPTYKINETKKVWINTKLRFYIDLHNSLITFRHLNRIIKWSIDDVWNRCEQVELKNGINLNLKTLSPVDNIVYLSCHLGFSHAFCNLLSFFDIYKIIKYNNINWDDLIMLSKKLKLNKNLYIVLQFINTYFENIIPQKTLSQFNFSKFEDNTIRFILNKNDKLNIYLVPIFLIDNNILRVKYLSYYIMKNFTNLSTYKKFYRVLKFRFIGN